MPSDPPPLPSPWPRRHNRPSCASFRQLQSLLSQHDKLVAEQEFYIDDLNDRFSDLNREIHYTGLAVQDHGAHSHNDLDRHEESARLAQRARKQATPTSYDDPGMKHRMRAVEDHDSRYRRNNGAAARSPPDQHISDVERDFFDFPLRDKSSLPIRNAPENRTCPGREYHRPGPDEPWDELERSIVPPVTEDMHKVLEDDPMSRFNMTRTPRAMACGGQLKSNTNKVHRKAVPQSYQKAGPGTQAMFSARASAQKMGSRKDRIGAIHLRVVVRERSSQLLQQTK